MKTLKELEEEYARNGLENYFSQMKAYAKSTVYLTLQKTDDSTLKTGISKIGGLPDLPGDIDWFYNESTGTPMTFICQINFEEIKNYDIEQKLPEKGILYFFYDCSEDGMTWGFDPADGKGRKVYFYDGDLSTLERKTPPQNLDEYGVLFDSAELSFEQGLELPDIFSSYGQFLNLSEEEKDRYWDLLDETAEEPVNKFLGHSNNIQGAMELECELVTNGLYCGNSTDYQSEKAKELEKNFVNWNLLLQIDSNDEIDMMWGDCGRLYLWITEENLKNRNFEDTWLILQCC